MRRPNELGLVTVALTTCLLVISCKQGGNREQPRQDGGNGTAPRAGTAAVEPGPAGSDGSAAEKRIFWNQVAGRFYPAQAEELGRQVDGFMADAAAPPAGVAGRDLIGFTSPHAGYPYSGPVAGHGYRLLEGREISTVVVLGFSHKVGNVKSAVLDFDAYRTPLGPMAVDVQMVEQLLARGEGVLDTSQAPFAGEHSLETQLPFIARAAPRARIVPIMVGRPEGGVDQPLVDLLYDVVGGRSDVVVVASTDLSHYEPYDDAVRKDTETLDMIASLDRAGIAAAGPGSGRMCGFYTVGVLMGLAARYGDAASGKLVRYLNSGDTAGDRSAGVVGYGVVAFTVPPGTRTSDPGGQTQLQGGNEGPHETAPAAPGSGLVGSVALAAAVAAVKAQSYEVTDEARQALSRRAAALVVVRVKGRIQGAAGSLVATGPLHEAVTAAAADAVASDPRFPSPVEADIPDMSCDVVVVDQTWSLADPDALAAFLDGTDHASGIHVTAGDQSAFVHALEGLQGAWDPEEIIAQACRRVGLSPTCHRPTKASKNEVEPVFTAFSGEWFSSASAGSGGVL